MRITLLGTGTSTGVPQIGCSCAVCTSSDVRDKRLRCSALVESADTRLLIDCGPDFRQQMLSRPFAKIDAVLITHEHYDHVGGLDDLRPFCQFGDIPVYALERTAAQLRNTLPYCFAVHKYPGVPRIDLRELTPMQPLVIGDLHITPLQVMHGRLPILGFRINNVAYVTDMTEMASSQAALLDGVDVLVINGLREKPHPTHQSIGQAAAFARQVRAGAAYIIHMSHHAGKHADIEATLPADIHLAYDNLIIDCP